MNNNEKHDILSDDRTIKGIWDEAGEGWCIGGVGEIEKIEAYPEPGECCNRPWFAVWKGGKIIQRVNSAYIANVVYAE